MTREEEVAQRVKELVACFGELEPEEWAVMIICDPGECLQCDTLVALAYEDALAKWRQDPANESPDFSGSIDG